MRYKAWGEDRYTYGTTPTTWRYTGQRQESGVGLYYYNARWYDPYLARFIQPDTIVPSPSSPQSLNRYSYVSNRPLVYLDPSGNRPLDEETLTYASPYRTLEEEAEALYQQALEEAYGYYCANFEQPFDDARDPSLPFGAVSGAYVHRGVDWAGSFPVKAPYGGVVTYAGADGTAGMWKIQSNQTGDVKEWSVFTGNALKTSDKVDGLYEPETLLATGNWADLEPGWGHTDGTVVAINHGHGLQTRYRHMDIDPSIAYGTRVSQGDTLGTSANHGHSTGAHLHYELIFTYAPFNRSQYLNPICP